MIAVIAVVCSTWSVVNRGTSKRDELVPEGQDRCLSVRRGNQMVSRCSLLLLLLGTLGFTYLLENPAQSIITAYPRLRWVLKALRRACVKVSLFVSVLQPFHLFVLDLYYYT